MVKAIICDIQGVLVDGNEINKDLVNFLVENKKNYGLLILYSNSGSKSRQKFIELVPEIFGIVDKEYFAFNFDYLKPNPKGFEEILYESNLKPQEVIFIDDNEMNVQAAKRIGINSFLYTDITTLETLLSP